MANIYVKLIEDAKKLPGSYRAMGTRSETWRDTHNSTSVTGWKICQFLYKMNEDGPDWWSNDFNLVVDEFGALWELLLGEEYRQYGNGRTSHVTLEPVNGEKLRVWHVNNWDFSKMKRSIEALV